MRRKLMAESASKVMSMRDAVARFVRDSDTVVIEGFTHLICLAAGHEIIRQGRRDLTLCRLTPDLIYDQMIAAGCARKLVFSWAGNPGVGSLHAFRRAVEGKGGPPLEIEEYSHFGMVARFAAGAGRPPLLPMRDHHGTPPPAPQPPPPHRTRPTRRGTTTATTISTSRGRRSRAIPAVSRDTSTSSSTGSRTARATWRNTQAWPRGSTRQPDIVPG